MSKDEKQNLNKESLNGHVEEIEVKTPKKQKKKTEKELLIEENEALKIENKVIADKMYRAVAELENFKKRTEKERTAERKYNNMYLIEKLLFALDQFNIVVNTEVEDPSLKNYLIGFKMINNQIFEILKEDGLEQIKTDGEMFDPALHNALEKEEDRTKAKGIILKTTQTGYKYKERIIRPAIVVVNEWSEEDGNNK